jgi:hypothetical protein
MRGKYKRKPNPEGVNAKKTKSHITPPEGRGPITPRLYDLYQQIRAFMMRYGYPPSTRDVGLMVGTKNRAYGAVVVQTLIDRGWLKRHGIRSRALVPADPLECPHCGKPITSWESPQPADSIVRPPPPPEPEPDPDAAVQIAITAFAGWEEPGDEASEVAGHPGDGQRGTEGVAEGAGGRDPAGGARPEG